MNQTVHSIRETLAGIYPPDEAAALTRIILCDIMGCSSVDYYLGKDMVLSPNETNKLAEILQRLGNFEPLQYIEGCTRFLGRPFRVAPGVLIPRPETEELVECIINSLATHDGSSAPLRLLDIGTGSGCIAISLALSLTRIEVEAWDISPEALAIARSNSLALGATVGFRQRDVLSYQPADNDRFDILVSNPPYVMQSERSTMHRNVLDWEPSLALFVPDEDPLRFYRRIGELGQVMLRPGGRLFFEINRAFGLQTANLLRTQGYEDIYIYKDISQNDRIVTASIGHRAKPY